MNELIELLHKERCSCVLKSGDRILTGRERGVKDLFRLLKTSPETLAGALIADKVVGKGAAALMALGGVAEVYADVISRPALEMLECAGIELTYGEAVPNIINRAGTGVCPVEALCEDCATPGECLPLIEKFINNQPEICKQQ